MKRFQNWSIKWSTFLPSQCSFLCYRFVLNITNKLIWTLVMLTNRFPKFMIQNFLEYIETIHCLWKFILNKLQIKSACYGIGAAKPFMSKETLNMVYCATFCSIMNCGLIFWGNSSHSAKIFKIQENINRIITGCRSRDSCRDLFKNLKILPILSQYILSLLLFVFNSKNKFKLNSDVCHINTRQKCNFHQPSSNWSHDQQGVYSNGIKLFNSLPHIIKPLSDKT